MRIKKKGFTLGEILVVMMIIGVIMALSIQSIRIVKTSYTSLAYFAFRNMQIATRDLYGGQTAKTVAEDSATILCRKSNGVSVHVFKPDSDVKYTTIPKCSELPTDTNDATKNLCSFIVKSLNTTGKINCTKLYTASKGEGGLDPEITNIDVLNPNFVTTNGQRYFLTTRTFSESVSKDYGYRLLAVDLNGKSKPNITKKDSKKMPPDIVTFMLLDNGELYPLGIAADNMELNQDTNINYISSKAKGYYYSNNKGQNSGNIPKECTVKTKSGTKQTCDFRVVSLKNSKNKLVYGYREALCMTLGEDEKLTFENYCYNTSRNPLCPPSSEQQRFDTCEVETVKPMFRFNLN